MNAKRSQNGTSGGLWSIILAAGEGERLRQSVQEWLGHHTPKQYCSFIGTRSMLEHTMDRADRISESACKVTVIAAAHRKVAWPQLRSRQGKVVLQPANRDTAAGVFLPLAYVRARDPRATVVVYPSDHFVCPEDRFAEDVRRAVHAVERLPSRLILLGVLPDSPEADYGWLHPGPDLDRLEDGHRVSAVAAFLEKPRPEEARKAMASGAMWNTLVMVAKVETLWAIGVRCLPGMMRHFESLTEVIGTRKEKTVLQRIYSVIPARNFARDILQRAVHDLALMELKGVLWSDWGRPDRIARTLRQIGRPSPFMLRVAGSPGGVGPPVPV